MSELASRYADSTIKFIKGPRSGIDVTNVSLAETVRDIPTHFYGFFSLYPESNGSMSYGFFSTDIAKDVTSLPNKVAAITVPERVKRLNIRSLPEERMLMEILCRTQGLPSIVVALGEQVDTGQETILLLAVLGYSVEEALTKAQESARRSISKRN